MADWIVIVARDRKKVGAELAAAGFDFYQPKFRERRVVRGRVDWVERFYLGCYVLVEFTFGWVERFYDLTGLRSVHSVLMSDELPRVVRHTEVALMQGAEVRGYVPVRRGPSHGAPGYIRRGRSAQLSARFDQRDEERGVDRVFVTLFGRSNVLDVPMGDWQPA